MSQQDFIAKTPVLVLEIDLQKPLSPWEFALQVHNDLKAEDISQLREVLHQQSKQKVQEIDSCYFHWQESEAMKYCFEIWPGGIVKGTLYSPPPSGVLRELRNVFLPGGEMVRKTRGGQIYPKDSYWWWARPILEAIYNREQDLAVKRCIKLLHNFVKDIVEPRKLLTPDAPFQIVTDFSMGRVHFYSLWPAQEDAMLAHLQSLDKGLDEWHSGDRSQLPPEVSWELEDVYATKRVIFALSPDGCGKITLARFYEENPEQELPDFLAFLRSFVRARILLQNAGISF